MERTSRKLIADGIGPDLRFASATLNQGARRGPVEPVPSDDTITPGLVGAPQAEGYSEEPF